MTDHEIVNDSGSPQHGGEAGSPRDALFYNNKQCCSSLTPVRLDKNFPTWFTIATDL
ncbi:hypothetical protein scyTo_0022529, partial [Scyliorhinus torazame]|nr:hypothetical protein [Scyliorhinus torazame]